MSRNMCAAAVRPANMRRPEGMHPTAAARPEAYSAVVPAKPAAMPAKACAVSTATMSTATMSTATMSAAAAMSAASMSPATATVPAATATPAGVCFECEKRYDDEHHRGHASASRQYQLHGAARLGAPHRRGRLSLGMSPRTKSF